MGVILGVIYHFIGGFASGSFYIPFKKVKGWHWESYWIVGGLFSWLIVPPLAAYLTVPSFADIIRQTDVTTLGLTFMFGVLWVSGDVHTVLVYVISALHWAAVLYLAYAWYSGR
jgi:L-rhamnose-H+ transport protein